MTNPPILVITGLGGDFILNFLQKSGYYITKKPEIVNTFSETVSNETWNASESLPFL